MALGAEGLEWVRTGLVTSGTAISVGSALFHWYSIEHWGLSAFPATGNLLIAPRHESGLYIFP